MNPKRSTSPVGSPRRGISLLELVIAGSLLATVMASLSLVMRTTRQSWETIDEEYSALHQMQAVSHHIVRQAREAAEVTQLTGSALSLRLPSGIATWRWRSSFGDDRDAVVFDSPDGNQSLLARDIDALEFVGYGADGTTVETDPSRVHVVQLRVVVTLPRSIVSQRAVTSKVWLRAW